MFLIFGTSDLKNESKKPGNHNISITSATAYSKNDELSGYIRNWRMLAKQVKCHKWMDISIKTLLLFLIVSYCTDRTAGFKHQQAQFLFHFISLFPFSFCFPSLSISSFFYPSQSYILWKVTHSVWSFSFAWNNNYRELDNNYTEFERHVCETKIDWWRVCSLENGEIFFWTNIW